MENLLNLILRDMEKAPYLRPIFTAHVEDHGKAQEGVVCPHQIFDIAQLFLFIDYVRTRIGEENNRAFSCPSEKSIEEYFSSPKDAQTFLDFLETVTCLLWVWFEAEKKILAFENIGDLKNYIDEYQQRGKRWNELTFSLGTWDVFLN